MTVPMMTTILHLLLFTQPAFPQTPDAISAMLAADSAAITSRNHHQINSVSNAVQSQSATGLLWRISGVGTTPSYLFGTMHVDDPRVTQLPEVVAHVFDRSNSLTLEAKLDLASLTAVATKMIVSDGQSLAGMLGSDLFAAVQDLLEQRGIPAPLAVKFKPWAVSVLLSAPRSSTGMFLDRVLHEHARRQDKPIHGIETLEEQISVFDELSVTDQVSLVKETVAQYAQLQNLIEELTQAYLQRNLTALVAVTDRYCEGNGSLAQRIKKRLVIERNIKMVARIYPRLREGNAFIAVGALHLPGANGMLALLRKKGLNVEVVY
jgi:uncharacterized protein YbaP (TraB family)